MKEDLQALVDVVKHDHDYLQPSTGHYPSCCGTCQAVMQAEATLELADDPDLIQYTALEPHPRFTLGQWGSLVDAGETKKPYHRWVRRQIAKEKQTEQREHEEHVAWDHFQNPLYGFLTAATSAKNLYEMVQAAGVTKFAHTDIEITEKLCRYAYKLHTE